MEKNRYRIVVLILIFCEIFCAVHIPSQGISENHRDVQITNEAAEQIHFAQTQELSENKEICNIRCYIHKSIIFFEIAKFAYEIAKVHVYIWQLPRGNIGGIMMKNELMFDSISHKPDIYCNVGGSCDREGYLWIIRRKLLQ